MQAAAPATSPPAGASALPLTLHVAPRVDRATIYQNKSLQRRCAPLSFSTPVNEVQVMVPMPKKFDGQCGFDGDSVQVEFGASFDGKVILAGVLVDEVERRCLRSDGTVAVEATRVAEVASASDSDADGEGAGDTSSANARRKLESQLRTVKQKLQLNEIAQAEAAAVRDYTVDCVTSAVEPCKAAPLMCTAALHDPEMWGAHLDALENATREHAKAKRELLRAKEALEAEKSELEMKLCVVNGGQSPRSGRSDEAGTTVDVVVLTLKVLKPVPAGPEAVVYVSYMVPSGRWNAVYEVHLNTVTNEVVLYYNAEVVLNYGDDLKDVSLTLSSAVPRRNAALPPAMTIWRCGVVQPSPPTPQFMMSPNAAMADCADDGICFALAERAPARCAAPMIKRAMAQVEQAGTGAIMNFAIPNPQTVMANGKTTRLPLAELRMPAAISYMSVPEKSLAAFTHAKITNTSDFLLLPGEVAVFLDGNYVLRSRIDKQCASGSKLDMYFGADPSVEIKRVLLRQANKVQSSYLKGKKNQVKTYAYRITIRNKKRATGSVDGALRIKLVEHIPISSEELLQVRLVSPAKPHEDVYIYDDEEDRVEQERRKLRLLNNEGIVEIERRVRAGESVELVFAFEVEAPSNATIYGL
ncbi:conserved hypothetical protein [Leishmania infantum JPCM5]|uniref:Domain_of_uncharacterized_function_(DUF4139)_-_pu tative n=2 Tax=Leishmania infantum TaxID=5671 RepID=A0A6L0XIZ9_LEIIN|nr:conserved hypothetical protein [Leishmania infantum JPCM5]CAC9509853.1 Domain_of_uncharacterised_function_(DUF4139)_-_putative [Leishmania infantum]CAM69786.1 conserved hypothetical protein [Leishmania infantum JPCM5]SUZ43733.1 Domain_of_uncharacterised_function_(DUF4139)_-_putative [Leishmania infantum]|eukprot:XP_001466739.1 conserved hypothetical protein [Leishmania infantum JPCM5]